MARHDTDTRPRGLRRLLRQTLRLPLTHSCTTLSHRSFTSPCRIVSHHIQSQSNHSAFEAYDPLVEVPYLARAIQQQPRSLFHSSSPSSRYKRSTRNLDDFSLAGPFCATPLLIVIFLFHLFCSIFSPTVPLRPPHSTPVTDHDWFIHRIFQLTISSFCQATSAISQFHAGAVSLFLDRAVDFCERAMGRLTVDPTLEALWIGATRV